MIYGQTGRTVFYSRYSLHGRSNHYRQAEFSLTVFALTGMNSEAHETEIAGA